MTVSGPESKVTIRAPQARDYPRMAELAGQLGYQSTGEDVAKRLAAMRNSSESAIFVAELPGGGIAGWIGVFIYRSIEADPRAEVNGLVVDESARSTGIGRRLLERAEEWGREKGCVAVGVRSNVLREGAHKFYERLGYTVNKTQKSFRKTL